MKQAIRALSLGLVAFFYTLGSANAVVLFSYTADLKGAFGGSNSFPPFSLSCSISTNEALYWYYQVTLFNVNWTTNDVGATLTATAATSGNFDSFAATMTDRNTNHLGFAVRKSTGGGILFNWLEPFVYFNDNPGSPADLQGNQIDSISLKLNSLSLTPGPPWDPKVDFSYRVTLSAVGHAIPEPSTCSLLALGVVALLGKRRLRRR